MWGRYDIVQALMHLVTLVFGGYTELRMEEAAAVGSCRFRTVVFASGGMIFSLPLLTEPCGLGVVTRRNDFVQQGRVCRAWEI